MPASGVSRAQQNRRIRQEALREQLANGGHLQHVIDLASKLADLDTNLEPNEVQRLKAAIDAKMKLVNKYLPELKATELTGEDGGPIQLKAIENIIVDPAKPDS